MRNLGRERRESTKRCAIEWGRETDDNRERILEEGRSEAKMEIGEIRRRPEIVTKE